MANPLVTRERIEQEVRAALATTLRTDADGIDMQASIINGLHATSIDFLDINFRLEGVFGVQMATQMLLDHVEEELGEGKAIDRDNKITAAGCPDAQAPPWRPARPRSRHVCRRDSRHRHAGGRGRRRGQDPGAPSGGLHLLRARRLGRATTVPRSCVRRAEKTRSTRTGMS